MRSVKSVEPPDVPEGMTVHEWRTPRLAARDGRASGSRSRGGDSHHPGLTAPEHRRLADVLINAARDRRAVERLSKR